MLPDEVLCLILRHVDFQGKCNMQLVCRKFSALLSSPPLGLWGEVDLVTDVMSRVYVMNREQKDDTSRQVTQSLALVRMP